MCFRKYLVPVALHLLNITVCGSESKHREQAPHLSLETWTLMLAYLNVYVSTNM